MLTDEHGVCREASDGECEALAQVELAQEMQDLMSTSYYANMMQALPWLSHES
jgi:hypothetical protein